MFEKNYLFCAIVGSVIAIIIGQGGVPRVKVPVTSFTCQGRGTGYYADMDTGCQVYHMCDSLGRKFSYSCPNTTLFQQRMLICDHWYMVNCSMSERDYKANLLIGQRDKPFVSDDEMRLRTPRPDILSVPPNNNFYDGLREAESKFPIHPDNNIVGIADSISNDNNGLDSAKRNYRPPTSWSTRSKSRFNAKVDNLDGAASQEPSPTIRPVPENENFKPDLINVKLGRPRPKPNQELEPPFSPVTESPAAESIPVPEDAVFKFIKRFDPNSPDSLKTAMTKSEIINLNQHLPQGQVSSEEDRTPKKQKNSGNTLNNVGKDNDKSFNQGTRFDSVNTKPVLEQSTVPEQTLNSDVIAPERILLPPKTDEEMTKSQIPSTTMGPPIYYEWKWAVPAFGLEPPKQGNNTFNISTVTTRSVVKSPFSDVTRSTIADEDATPVPRNVEYNISSYFVPDYVFPLDNPHPGYNKDDAQTSFQVQVSRPGRASYGENPKCPHCHPAYLEPGTCEPCIVKR